MNASSPRTSGISTGVGSTVAAASGDALGSGVRRSAVDGGDGSKVGELRNDVTGLGIAAGLVSGVGGVTAGVNVAAEASRATARIASSGAMRLIGDRIFEPARTREQRSVASLARTFLSLTAAASPINAGGWVGRAGTRWDVGGPNSS
jgi:hypothetical protein